MTVAELLGRISSRELSEWMAYFEIEGPTGDARADWRAGMLASVIANANRDPKRSPRAFEPQDFMPYQERETFDGAAVAFAHALQKQLGGEISYGDPGDPGS